MFRTDPGAMSLEAACRGDGHLRNPYHYLYLSKLTCINVSASPPTALMLIQAAVPHCICAFCRWAYIMPVLLCAMRALMCCHTWNAASCKEVPLLMPLHSCQMFSHKCSMPQPRCSGLLSQSAAIERHLYWIPFKTPATDLPCRFYELKGCKTRNKNMVVP
jgi:hypothetical protein